MGELLSLQRGTSEGRYFSHSSQAKRTVYLADNRTNALPQRALKDARPRVDRIKQYKQKIARSAPTISDNATQLAAVSAPHQQSESVSSSPNHTGLPAPLKSGVEALSGMSMDHVRVHYNSAKPAQLNAHAYAQDSDIHLASGQEKHLPHEAWHVVQQAQGRVQPTRQMKSGVPVNDEDGLEAEADVMGEKALQLSQMVRNDDEDEPEWLHSEVTTQKNQNLPFASSESQNLHGNSVAQMVVAPQGGPYGEEGPLFANIVQNIRPPGTSAQNFALLRGMFSAIGEINWVSSALEGNEIINAALGSLEDDEDIDFLRGIEGQLDPLVEQGNALVEQFNAGNFDQRIVIAGQLVNLRLQILPLVAQLRANFAPGGGGFGAIGRATEVEGRTVEEGQREGGPNASDRFLAETILAGNALTDTHHVEGGQDQAHQIGPIRLVVAGQNIPPPYAPLNADDIAIVENILNAIPAPAPQEKQANQDFFVRARGPGGQQAAMANTNARGYAWFYGVNGWNQTRWEWLHLRGAGLGGATDGTNLVLGTRDANTQMIPFESHVRALQTVARASGNYIGVGVRWQATAPILRHAYENIVMQWDAPRTVQGEQADSPRLDGEVTIHPLAGGQVLSKAEVRHIEDALVSIRDAVVVPEQAGDAM